MEGSSENPLVLLQDIIFICSSNTIFICSKLALKTFLFPEDLSVRNTVEGRFMYDIKELVENTIMYDIKRRAGAVAEKKLDNVNTTNTEAVSMNNTEYKNQITNETKVIKHCSSFIDQIGFALRNKISSKSNKRECAKSVSNGININKILLQNMVEGTRSDWECYEKMKKKSDNIDKKCQKVKVVTKPEENLVTCSNVDIKIKEEEARIKALKKKEKKQRQKEKKNKIEENEKEIHKTECENEKEVHKIECENDDSVIIDIKKIKTLQDVQKNIKTRTNETRENSVEKTSIINDEELSNSGESSAHDIDFINDDDDYIPAFIKSTYDKSLKKGEIKCLQKIVKEVSDGSNEHTKVHEGIEVEKKALLELKTSKHCIGRACLLTMRNQTQFALQCFKRAIQLDPNNLGHYLNRSFYYLRTNSLKLAFKDAEYVLSKTNNVHQMAIAKFRLGQIYHCLENYTNAEKYFEESFNLNPEDKSVLREWLYVKVKQLVSMGFNEKCALEVMYETEELADACNRLNLRSDSEIKKEKPKIPFTSEKEIYYSDDENDVNNIVTLTNVVNYHYEKHKSTNESNELTTKFASPLKKEIQGMKNKELIKKNKISTDDYKYNDRTIWVGSLAPTITNKMIKEKFKKYGKVNSVLRPVEKTWAFVNFENPISVAELLSDSSNYKINDIKISVQPRKNDCYRIAC